MSDDQKEQPTTIWLLMSGEYSGTDWIAAFPTEELAQAAADLENLNRGKYGDYHWITSVPFHQTAQRVMRWHVKIRNHMGWEYIEHSAGIPTWEPIEEVEAWSGVGNTYAAATATSEERALKIARDAIARRKAEEAGQT